MKNERQFDAYEAYMDRLNAVSGIPLVNSIEDANRAWGVRKLSRSEFDKLKAQSQSDPELEARWLNRLQAGYDREKSQLAIEIEEIFSDVPCADHLDGRENAA